ncbi:MAG: YifB family Mg chelatase-like AAA ATPase [Pseudomonadota bacterium]
MYAQMTSVALIGIDARPVEIQVQVAPGLPAFSIVGLPDKAVAESRERIRAALHALGLGLPAKRIAVNLAPADVPKEGSHFDLPIALALIAACGVISADFLRDYCAFGELSLDARVCAVPGALPAAMGAKALGKGVICARSSGSEVAWAAADQDIIAGETLIDVLNHAKGVQSLARPKPQVVDLHAETGPCLGDVRGQETAKRALEVAAAGGHNILFIGPPGAGKSMLAARLPGLLPPLQPAELLELAMVRSLAGDMTQTGMSAARPFRAPHHSASMAALCGGGVRPKPGEIALAHHGVLFLDELPEFNPNVLDALRQPLETRSISVARANHRVTYPANVQLIGAMNPCRCGNSRPGTPCRGGRSCQDRYVARLSGPLLDRIDMLIHVEALSIQDLAARNGGETSRTVAARVATARQEQMRRYTPSERSGLALSQPDVSVTNASIATAQLEATANCNGAAHAILIDGATKFGLTARGYHRTLRVARTIADLACSPDIKQHHVAEALSYRQTINAPREMTAA